MDAGPPSEVPSKSDVESLRSLFLSGFNHPRNSDQDEGMKNQTRSLVLEHFQSLGLETFTHEFVIKHKSPSSSLIGSVLTADESKDDNDRDTETGINLIGILPSKIRSSGQKNVTEHLMVIAAHYDTVSKCPGIDDNGSGSVTTLTCATILSRFIQERGSYESTSILFVLFDLEEKVRSH